MRRSHLHLFRSILVAFVVDCASLVLLDLGGVYIGLSLKATIEQTPAPWALLQRSSNTQYIVGVVEWLRLPESYMLATPITLIGLHLSLCALILFFRLRSVRLHSFISALSRSVVATSLVAFVLLVPAVVLFNSPITVGAFCAPSAVRISYVCAITTTLVVVVVLDTQQTLARGRRIQGRCNKCGYLLLGIGSTRCPECGIENRRAIVSVR